jgi:hypothetical protein
MLSLVEALRRVRQLVSLDQFGGFNPSSGYFEPRRGRPIPIFEAAI